MKTKGLILPAALFTLFLLSAIPLTQFITPVRTADPPSSEAGTDITVMDTTTGDVNIIAGA